MNPEQVFLEGVEAQKVAHLLRKGFIGRFSVPASDRAHNFIREIAARLGRSVALVSRTVLQIQ